MAGRRLSFKQQLRVRTGWDQMDGPLCDPADPPGEGDTGLMDLPEDCLGLVLDLLDPVTVGILERVSKGLHAMIQVTWATRNSFLMVFLSGTSVLEKIPDPFGAQAPLFVPQVNITTEWCFPFFFSFLRGKLSSS